MSSTRSTIAPPPFAANALTVIPPTPVAGVSYRDPAAGPASSADGWPYAERVNSAEFNQILFQATTLLSIIDKKGILGWSDQVNYTEASLCFGSDGSLYLWLIPSGPAGAGAKDPISNPTYWKLLVQAATDVIAGVAPNAFRNTAVYRRSGGVQQVSVNGAAFTATGATTFIYPASGVVEKRVWGGGGGGGGVSGAAAAASGGNGGGYSEGIFKAAPGTSESVSVGAGGAGGTGTGNGGNGGTSIAGTVVCTGGGGGIGTNSGTVPANTTTFGSGSGGQFNVSGSGASGSFQAAGYIASGGGGVFGTPPSPNTTGLGAAGNFPGGGGSGGSNINNGGAGADGFVIYKY